MPNTSSSNHVLRIVPSKHSSTHIRKSANYAEIQNELNRLRTVLTHETMTSHPITTEPELFPDPIDQTAAEHEIGVALSVKMLAIDKLRRIEQALTSLHAHSYGICCRCSQEIPYARLKVQPDSLYCVPCLTAVEQEAARNEPYDEHLHRAAHTSESNCAPLAHLAPRACPFLPGEGTGPGLRLTKEGLCSAPAVPV